MCWFTDQTFSNALNTFPQRYTGAYKYTIKQIDATFRKWKRSMYVSKWELIDQVSIHSMCYRIMEKVHVHFVPLIGADKSMVVYSMYKLDD